MFFVLRDSIYCKRTYSYKFVIRRGSGVRVSGGHLGAAKAPTDAAAENDRKAPAFRFEHLMTIKLIIIDCP